MGQHVADGSVDLVYLDPPFNSDRDYNAPGSLDLADPLPRRDRRPRSDRLRRTNGTHHTPSHSYASSTTAASAHPAGRRPAAGGSLPPSPRTDAPSHHHRRTRGGSLRWLSIASPNLPQTRLGRSVPVGSAKAVRGWIAADTLPAHRFGKGSIVLARRGSNEQNRSQIPPAEMVRGRCGQRRRTPPADLTQSEVLSRRATTPSDHDRRVDLRRQARGVRPAAPGTNVSGPAGLGPTYRHRPGRLSQPKTRQNPRCAEVRRPHRRREEDRTLWSGMRARVDRTNAAEEALRGSAARVGDE